MKKEIAVVLIIAVILSFLGGWGVRDRDITGVWYFQNKAPKIYSNATRMTFYKDDVVYMSQDNKTFTITARGLMLYEQIDDNFLVPKDGDISVWSTGNMDLTFKDVLEK